MTGGLFQLLAYGAQDLFVERRIVTLTKLGKYIQRKINIWKYVFNWLTKPITNDGLLGIKSFGELNEAPLTL